MGHGFSILYSHTIISDFNSLDSHSLADIETAWNRLSSGFKTPLLGFNWFHTCATTIHSMDQLTIVIVSDDHEIVAIAPLCLTFESGYARLQILGSVSLYEPAGLLYYDESSLRYLLRAVLQLGRPVELSRISDETLLSTVTDSIAWSNGVRFIVSTAPSNYICTSGSWRDIEQKMSRSRHADLRRKRRRAEKIGQVDVRVLVPTLDDFDTHFETALDIEHASWKGDAGSSLVDNSVLRAFFDAYCRQACANQHLRFFFLDIDGVPVAMHIAIESDQALWILKLGYRQEYSNCSPGIALAHSSIQYCFEKGLSRYEFLGSTEGWQSAWPSQQRGYHSVLLFPWSGSGIIGLASLAAGQLARKFRQVSLKPTNHSIRNTGPNN